LTEITYKKKQCENKGLGILTCNILDKLLDFSERNWMNVVDLWEFGGNWACCFEFA